MKQYILIIIFIFFISPVKSQGLTIMELMIHEDRMYEEFDNLSARMSILSHELQDTKNTLQFLNTLILGILKNEHNISGEEFKKMYQELEKASGFKIK